jgi:hypothetical protein
MILIPLICSNFIIFRLNNKQPLAQDIPPPPHRSKEPFFRGVEIPLIDSRLWASGWLHKTILQGCSDSTREQPPVSSRMAPRNHSSGVLQYHPLTATRAVSLSLLKLRTQLNTRDARSALSTKLHIIEGRASTTGSDYEAAPFHRHARLG